MAGHHPKKKIVGYLRTSTDDQLLGIDAQRERLEDIAGRRGCDVAQVFTEHESGGNNDRPELDKALRLARRLRAPLVVAKLDRLARDQQFTMKLVDGNVPIIFGDLEDVDITTPEGRMMLQVFGTFAEFERRRIGSRTREALKILKKQGVKLGAANPNCRKLTREARKKGSARSAEKSKARAVDEQSDIADIASQMKAEGRSLARIAAHLDAEHIPTREGSQKTLQGQCRKCEGWGPASEPCAQCGPPRTFDPEFRSRWKGGWSAVQVKRILDRLKPA
jgi:DNA invertase Pin-like site-specific DNA recombinase